MSDILFADGSSIAGDLNAGVAGEQLIYALIRQLALAYSPTFTGIPAAPTPAADTNTAQLATTAFVVGQAASTAPVAASSTAAAGSSARYARQDHVHPYDPGWVNTPMAGLALVLSIIGSSVGLHKTRDDSAGGIILPTPVRFDGAMLLSIPTAAPVDAAIPNSHAAVWYDEAGAKLTFRCRLSNGTLVTKQV